MTYRDLGRRRSPAPPACLAATLLLAASPAQAQKPPAAPAPKAEAAATPAAKKTSIRVVAERPGDYELMLSGEGAVGRLAPSGTPVEVPPGATLVVIDRSNETVARFDGAKYKAGQTVKVSPADFKYVASVSVPVSAGGKPVAAGVVTLADAAGKTQSVRLTEADRGVARFAEVPIGKATVRASHTADGPKATVETTITPAKGGAAPEVPVALSGSVPTLEIPASPAPAAAGMSAAAPSPSIAEQPANNWVPGVVGLALMAGGIVYGIRYAKNKGVTVEGVLKQIGVTMPQDGVAPGGLAAPLKPAPPPLPPLPSLSDLPAASPTPAGAAVASFGSAPGSGGGTATAVRTAPRLVGLSGALSGEQFPLDAAAPFTVGRDETASLALPQDKAVSRRHARFAPDGAGGWAVSDEGSSNGTFVNGQRVSGTHALRPGDEVQIGGARLRYEG